MADEHRCVVCPQLRQGEPRIWERANVCEGCRAKLAQILTDIGEGRDTLGDHLERGTTTGQRVTGGDTEAPLPFREDVWDLLLPAKLQAVHDSHGDQIGYASIATILSAWAADWADARDKGEFGLGSISWLQDRLEWACDQHHPEALAAFAAEMRDLRAAIRRYTGGPEPRATPCVGVPCRRCDLKTLAKLANGSGDVECQNGDCRLVYRPHEYEAWVRLVAAASPA